MAGDSDIDGYITPEQASRMLGVSKNRIYQLILEGRLPAKRVGRSYLLPLEEVENFVRQPRGRMRVEGPEWRPAYTTGRILATEITVRVKEGKEQYLQGRLDLMRQNQRHNFTGSVARYVLTPEHNEQTVNIILIWRDVEMPDDQTHTEELNTFRNELADLLDWPTARYEYKIARLYT